MARRFDSLYKVLRNANLGEPEFWNKRFEDIDLRLAARELDGDKIDAAVATMISVALGRLNDAFTPVVNEAIERLASVGALFSSTSDSETNISLGEKSFALDQHTRDSFVVPEYVSIRPHNLSDRGMIAKVVEYDRNTGLLDVSVALVTGTGTYSSWDIRLSGTPDLEHATRTDNPHETTAAQVGAYTKAEVDEALDTAIDGAIDALGAAAHKNIASAAGIRANNVGSDVVSVDKAYDAAKWVPLGNITGAVTIDANTGARFRGTLVGNVTIDVTNLKDGAPFELAFVQDATGGRTVSWNAKFKWPSAAAPEVATAANGYAVIVTSVGAWNGDVIAAGWKVSA